jgi:hypothetical protein
MNRDEFTTLPTPLALGVLYDIAQAKLEMVERPLVPRPPKYDDRFSKKKGFYCWVSEMTLEDLQWWQGKKSESANGGGEWAEKDAKWVAKLGKWIEWRRLFPYETWSGTRGDSRATARPPGRDPELHAWGPRNGGGNNNQPAPAASPDDDGRASSDDEFAF